MKIIALFILSIIGRVAVNGQSTSISGASNINQQRIFSMSIPLKASFVLSYSEQSYWWSDEERYRILAFDGKVWTAWKYSKKWKSSTERLEKCLPLNRKYYRKIRVIDSMAISILLDSLQSAGLWTLNQDSLEVTRGKVIDDAVEYIFQKESAGNIEVKSSYAPEYYLETDPAIIERIKFINARDIFTRWWKRHCS